MKMKVLEYEGLKALNDSSIKAGRSQNLPAEQLAEAQDRYWINEHRLRERDGQSEVRICVVLGLFTSQTAWLDVSPDEFAAIPEIDVSEEEWETAMCAGAPPSPP